MNNETSIFGIRAIIEAINSGKNIDKVFIQKGLRGDLFQQLEITLRKSKISTSYVLLKNLIDCQKGITKVLLLIFHLLSFMTLRNLFHLPLNLVKSLLFLLLDQLSDVRNFGAIVRTAECTGVSGIIIQKKGGAPVNADAIKTSAGAMFKIPICKVDHIKDAIYHLQASEIKVIAATEKANQMVYDHDLKVPLGIVMGSEGRGINPSVIKICDESIKLPIIGEIESLNVSVACGAILYEIVRQRI